MAFGGISNGFGSCLPIEFHFMTSLTWEGGIMVGCSRQHDVDDLA